MTERLRAPKAVRWAGVTVAAEAMAAVSAAGVLAVRGLAGADQRVVNGFGTALWFVLVGVGLLAAAWALWTGRRWGRGVAVFAQLLLLPVSWYMGVGSHQWAYAIPVAIVAIVTLVLLFSPSAVQWLGAQDPGSGSASADSSGPDTR
jgi:glucose dehydrogenase